MNRTTNHALLALFTGVLLTTVISYSKPAVASEPFIGTIRYVGFNFAPRGWALCDGQLLAISQNDALFSLFGTLYGGDGRTTFGLPDLRGRFPVHQGTGPGLTNRRLGAKAGVERVTLTTNMLPSHNHALRGSNGVGNQTSPTGHSLAKDNGDNTYRNAAPDVTMHAASIGNHIGGSQSHENRSPSLGVYCTVALVGIYPSRN